MNTMNAMPSNGTRKMTRKFSVLFDEAVWQFALVALVVAVLVDGAVSIGGGTIA